MLLKREDVLRKISDAKESIIAKISSLSSIGSIETKYTLHQLKMLLEDSLKTKFDLELEQQLIEFLYHRWERIKNSNLEYFHDLINPANIICTELAQDVSRYSSIHYLDLLIPSLQATPDDAYVTGVSHRSPHVNLQSMILSERGDYIIEVSSTLELSEQDGLLKHAVLNRGQIKLLSPNETTKVLSRDPAIREVYLAIQECLHANEEKYNLEMHLQEKKGHMHEALKKIKQHLYYKEPTPRLVLSILNCITQDNCFEVLDKQDAIFIFNYCADNTLIQTELSGLLRRLINTYQIDNTERTIGLTSEAQNLIRRLLVPSAKRNTAHLGSNNFFQIHQSMHHTDHEELASEYNDGLHCK